MPDVCSSSRVIYYGRHKVGELFIRLSDDDRKSGAAYAQQVLAKRFLENMLIVAAKLPF